MDPRRIEALVGSRVRDPLPVSGGCINACFRVDLDDGRRVFVKTNEAAPPRMFPEEARGLDALASAEGGPPVPAVVAVAEDALVLEWLPPGRVGPDGWADLGRALAALHRKTATAHGFEADNYIGSTPQKNGWNADGVAFFAESRIGHQVRLAAEQGLLGAGSRAAAERLMARLPELLPADEPPALLHGDLWSGNVHGRADGVACLVDPAAYFGYREADLAMTQLFGRFPQVFYDAYDEAWPRLAGHQARVDLFNLYHLLNHLNLFGGSYRTSVESILKAWA
jgi:protein-ribulosamine 3-kinase